jgi:hypothetical protein
MRLSSVIKICRGSTLARYGRALSGDPVRAAVSAGTGVIVARVVAGDIMFSSLGGGDIFIGSVSDATGESE